MCSGVCFSSFLFLSFSLSFSIKENMILQALLYYYYCALIFLWHFLWFVDCLLSFSLKQNIENDLVVFRRWLQERFDILKTPMKSSSLHPWECESQTNILSFQPAEPVREWSIWGYYSISQDEHNRTVPKLYILPISALRSTAHTAPNRLLPVKSERTFPIALLLTDASNFMMGSRSWIAFFRSPDERQDITADWMMAGGVCASHKHCFGSIRMREWIIE